MSNKASESVPEAKVVLVGLGGSGKTSFLIKYITGEFGPTTGKYCFFILP